MYNIKIGRYSFPEKLSHGWEGWIEPEDKSWIVYVASDGKPVVYLDRDPDTGAIIFPDTVAA